MLFITVLMHKLMCPQHSPDCTSCVTYAAAVTMCMIALTFRIHSIQVITHAHARHKASAGAVIKQGPAEQVSNEIVQKPCSLMSIVL